jgi:RNA polymerase sigma-70 factor (ECF subfamily)
MVRVLQNLNAFNGRYALRPWVARIARNVCLDALRAKTRRQANGEELNGDLPDRPNGNGHADGDPSEVVERLAEKEDVHAHLAQLPEQHRVALVLRELEGFSHREIAQVIGTSPARVKALLHRARRGFRRAWDGEDNGRRKLGLLVPLLAPLNAMRRLFGRVQEIDVSGVASAPATHVASSTGAERLSAAVAAVVVAGTVGVAATRGPDEAPNRRKPETVVLAAPVEHESETQPASSGGANRNNERRRQLKRSAGAKESRSEAPAPASSPDPGLAVVASPSPDTDAGVQEVPRPATQPTPSAPGGFSFSFRSSATSAHPCNCGSMGALGEDSVTASASRLISFSQSITGGSIRDAAGRPGWAVDVRQSGTERAHELAFQVVSQGGIHQFSGQGTLVSRAATRWGGWVLTYSGAYEWRGGPGDSPTGLPDDGSYTAILTFSYEEARLVGAEFSIR